MFDKNIWLESESGPENTIIDLTGAWTFWVVGGQDTTSGIRGFTIMNNLEDFCNGINLSGAHPKIVNNIFTGPNLSCVWTGQTESNIRNNLMINVSIGAQIAHSWGDFSNNMIVHTSRWGFWNAAGHGQLIVPDYNLFWNVEELFGGSPFGWGEHNIDDQEPIFIIGSYRLQEGSPGIDQGRPDLLDPDGSRSDIGVYGGPYAYPIN